MKFILYSPTNIEDFFPITESISSELLPVLNKTLIEHTIDYLFKEEIKKVTILLRNFPYETKVFLGNGERWGVEINYKVLSGEDSLTCNQIFADEEEDLFLFPINFLSDYSIKNILEQITKNEIDFLILNSGEGKIDNLSGLTKDLCSIDKPIYLSKKSLSFLKKYSGKLLLYGLKEIISQNINAKLLEVPNRFEQINSLQDLLAVNVKLLQNPLTSTLFPGIKAEDGLYISPGVKIPNHNKSFLLLGQNTEIKGGSNLCKNSIIGDNCIIDEGSIIENSLICKNQYIGAHTEIKDCIVFNKYLIKPKENIVTYISEDFIIGDISDKNIYYNKFGEFFQRIIALLLLIFFSPITLFLYLVNLVLPKSKKILEKEKVPLYTTIKDMSGVLLVNEVELPFFNLGIRIIDKLPSLWSVVMGNQLLIGTGPRINTDMPQLSELYKTTDLAPPGVIRIWEIEKQNMVEEKIISELYYSKQRTFRSDVKILFRFFTGK